MSDGSDRSPKRRVSDDVGVVREWAEVEDLVPVRTERSTGTSEAVALVHEDVAGDHERLDWPGFADVLHGSGKLVQYDETAESDRLSVVDADGVDRDAVRHEETGGSGHGEHDSETSDYPEHEMRGEGAPAAPAGEDRPEEGTREARADREEPTATGLVLDDVGKSVVDADGNEIGVVAQASREDGRVQIDVDPGLTERILSKLGWTGERDVDYAVSPEHIRRVTDDRVVLDPGDEPADEE